MSNTFDKLSILDSFIEEVDSYLPEIEANLDRMAQDVQAGRATSDKDLLEETYRRTHTIGGSASMMDFSGLEHIAHGMEDILADALEDVAPLDAPTIALLQRSLGRLRILLEGIHGEVDDNALIEEDDADYEQYRIQQEQVRSVPEQQRTPLEESLQPTIPMSPVFEMPQHSEGGASSSSLLPSFDEVLASFLAPSADADSDVEWPEEYAEQEIAASPVAVQQTNQQQEPASDAVSSPSTPSTTIPDSLEVRSHQQSALEELVASTAAAQQPVVPAAPRGEVSNPMPEEHLSPVLERQEEKAVQAVQARQGVSDVQLPQAYSDLERDAQSLENQTVSIQHLISQLRSAVSLIERQRSEFKGFLDGSKDALDRMEDWAGRTMGLDLRNSPEQVRKYLPLSVMWAANSKLKKVLEVLNQVTNGIELTDEQMQLVVRHLQESIAAWGDAFYNAQIEAPARVLTQEQEWSPWEVRETRDAEHGLQERVTFERYGNLDEIRAQMRNELQAEMEATLRNELESEYKTISLASRTELEQKIRSEVRQELEANRRLQEQVSGVDVNRLRQELERQLRNEIEIQVRQEFLDTIGTTGVGLLPHPLDGQRLPAPSNTANAASIAQTAQESFKQSENPVHSVITPTTETGQSSTLSTPSVSSTPTLSNNFTEETAEIFRLEAEEHLQTISTSVASLEKEPANREYIQSIRRAMHTLKGAAGMMGFRTIAELSHISEDLLDSIMEGTTSISPQVLSIILDTAETLDGLINGKTENAVEEAQVQSLRARYADLLGEQVRAASSSILSHDEIGVDDEADDVEHLANAALITDETAASSHFAVGLQSQGAARNDLSVRVHLQRLDELVNLFGELLVNRSVLEERIQRMVRLVADVGISSNRLRDVGQRLESRFEAATLPSGRSLVVMPGEGDASSLESSNGKSIEPAHLADFDMLEMDRYTEFHQLARGLSEGISDMSTLSTEMDAIIRECESVFARENRLSTTFQDRLLKTRLVPLSTMAPRLDRAARAVAFKQRKEFEFVLEGGETEVDRTVYEEIAGPLLHLMRNAVNHAIETPDIRIQHGKPAQGRITFTAAYENNQIVITVRDDGSGIDPEHIRRIAIERGLIPSDQPLSASEAIELIFRPGFSTAEVLSEESGRGVGLDVVRDSVLRLRGTIEVESTPGQGTAFTMRFPTSLAIQSAMMVMVSGQQFAIPTTMIESIGRLDTFKRTTSGGQPAVIVRDEFYPLSMLAQYLNLPVGQVTEKSHILLINAAGQRMALVIDEVKGKFDVVVKNLGPHLRNVHGIAGATVLGNGQVVLILELIELLSTRNKLVGTSANTVPSPRESQVTTVSPDMRSSASLGSQTTSMSPLPQSPSVSQTSRVAQQVPQARTSSMQPAVEKSPVISSSTSGEGARQSSGAGRGKYVLVVDDSPSVRRVVGNMLKQHNWDVQMARDGVEALEFIARETPAAVLLDIEMPRMDGYELIATVRAQEQYRTLPLVVLTSRAAAKHQQRAMQLGASGYVVKPYQDEELLNTLNALVYGAVVR